MSAAKAGAVKAPKAGTKAPGAGDRDLRAVFTRLKALLEPYEGRLAKRVLSERRYELWSEKAVVFAGRPRNEVFFAALIIQGSYVGFYFMPIYVDPSLAGVIAPDLRKLLKGKSCFHVRKLDSSLERAIAAALKKGFALYKTRGWV